ncbi:fumarylacetoacetate hydrolase family protein [Kribbella solani]|uniref:fumarylacetoacetate hydrolase family protein n=1 Tax=Kribbella solani TaxID=236067 RepID=UPI0029B90F9D|nr:fumarylacetoacetate hydrolase family protein [Kribbella solani]MDX2972533.1 fumarylacetoacetate hydrolase family protein [Kribbella solani]MDX3006712.1 fumarylacetoacetate hydrolase family protein [Kribbella solani]
MHLVRYLSPVDGRPIPGVRTGDSVAPLEGVNSFAELLRLPLAELQTAVGKVGAELPAAGLTFLPPLDGRGEVWCAGVTYERSRGARMEESSEQSVYDKVYTAERPELFQKAPAWRVVVDGEPVGIRSDSGHDVPEPELAVVANSHGEIVGYTICNDMSSRSIEGINPLYVPQAKLFAGGCALAAGIRPAWEVKDPKNLGIELVIERDGTEVFAERTSTAKLVRELPELIDVLFLPNDFPDGVILATGTGIVPDLDFALTEGDVITITIDELGTLTNTVATGRAPFTFLATTNLEGTR